jgi:hypothetical protein
MMDGAGTDEEENSSAGVARSPSDSESEGTQMNYLLDILRVGRAAGLGRGGHSKR